MTEKKTDPAVKTVKIKVLQMAWVNIYAPFYIAMCLLEKGCPKEKGNGQCNEDCELEKLCKKIKEINNNQISWKIEFDERKSDKAIIEELKANKRNQTNDFVIGICDPISTDKNNDALEITPFVNRLPVYGFTNYDFASPKKNEFLDIFQSSINFRFRDTMDEIFSSGKRFRIYSYPEGSTIFNLLLKGLNEGEKEGKPLLEIEKILDNGGLTKNLEFEEYRVTYNNKSYKGNKLKHTKKNIEFYSFSPAHLFFDILYKQENEEDSVWILFTVEPAEPFRRGWKDNLQLIYSSVPQLSNFTSIILRKTEKLDMHKDEKIILKKALNASIHFFYANDFTISSLESNKKRTAIKIIDDYIEKHRKMSNRGGFAREESRSTVGILAHDLLEWEIFKNQRVYAFDIERVSEQWQYAFGKVIDEIKEIINSKEDNGSKPFDEVKKRILDDARIVNKDIRDNIKFLFNTLSELYDQQILASKKSALAAIVSRNMSHNIGSHVINYLKRHVDILGENFNNLIDNTELCKKLDPSFIINDPSVSEADNFLKPAMYAFLEYLNRRMEFIANLTTNVPSISSEMDFERNIFNPLVNDNRFIANFIAKSDLKKIEEETTAQCNLTIKLGDKPENKNILMSIPDGLVGAHAFYTILENFIRNSAKHGFAASGKNELVVTVSVYDHDGYFRVRIQDNLGTGKKLLTALNPSEGSEKSGDTIKGNRDFPFLEPKEIDGETFLYFRPPEFVDTKGNLIHSLWGLKEMYIGACYLRGLSIEDYDKDYDNEDNLPIIAAGVDDSENLFVEFFMFKPKTLLIVANNDGNNLEKYKAFQKKYKDKGVDLISYDDFESFFPRHRFCLLCDCPRSNLIDDDQSFYSVHKDFLPIRLFCDCSNSAPPYVQWKPEWMNCINGIFESCYQTIYEKWIKAFYKIKELPELVFIDIPHFSKTAWNGLVKNLKKSEETAFIANQTAEQQIFLIGHLKKDYWEKNIAPTVKKEEGKRLIFEAVTSGNSTKSIINNTLNPAIKKFEIIEAYLARVIIIDERIYNNCKKDTYDAYWERLDVRLYNFIPAKKNEAEESIDGYFEYAKDANGNSATGKTIPLGDFFCDEKPFKEKAHFLVIHRGIVEKIADNSSKGINEVFADCRKIAENIIVTSGRGKPDYIGESEDLRDLRFVNIENVYAWFFDCKFSLVQGLFSIINRKKGK